MAGAAALRAVKTGTKATAKIGKVGSKAGSAGRAPSTELRSTLKSNTSQLPAFDVSRETK